ncbi:S8 family serine peptidase [uncultured Sphingomonas sp.]|uniref:S8 family serine peptidase n=1 Tax=uncultured Sphingomonas sp. TaxID=158754 RepID=UPI0035C9AB60
MAVGWRWRIVTGAALTLGACSGGGGGGNASTPPPPTATPEPPPAPTPPAPTPPAPTPTPPPPPPTPTPTPPATGADTPEYRATVGAVSMNALAAYTRGATGAGIGVAVIDTGVDLQSEEFTGRVSAASRDVAGNADADDQSGHGTAVAFTVAGRRNGAGTHGVAYESTLIALRADRPGSCATEVVDDDETGCRFGTDAIARGVDAARLAGARVVNISLGGGDPMPPPLRDAISRATAAGLVIVIAAGNEATADPDPFSLVATDAGVARGQVIIAGSVGAGDGISDFSDRAGSGAQAFLSAVGERVRAPDEAGTPFLWSGTSFAAPQISGAAALLAQAFPNLSGARIVELLLTTARDVGAPGIDPVYGRGVLDLSRAFQPVGVVSVAGSGAAVSLGANGTLSAPMGDARASGAGAVILDGFSRAFAIDLADGLRHDAPTRALGRALGGGRVRSVGMADDTTGVAMTLAPVGPQGVLLRRTELAPGDAEAARLVAGLVTRRLGSRASFAFGFGTGGQALGARLGGSTEPAFLIAGAGGHGFDAGPDGAAAIRHRFGSLGLTVAAESGRVSSRRDEDERGGLWRRSGYDRVALTLDRRIGAVAATLTGSRLAERSTLLGARIGAALGSPAGTSWFADAGARVDLGEGWTLGGGYRRGWTTARLSGLEGGGLLRSAAWSADIGATGLWLAGDGAGLRIAQPLRVATGGLDLLLPTNWSYAERRVDAWTRQSLGLAPTGRELDVEARYAFPLGAGTLEGNLFWRRDPGHISRGPDDRGMAVRYGFAF